MHRRGFLIGALGAAAAATVARADIKCTPWSAQGVRQCNVGVRVPLRTARQRCPNWCWAACVEAIFAMNGIQVTQDSITRQLFGGLICMPSAGAGITAGINGRWRVGGKYFDIAAELLWNERGFFARPEAVARAADELAKGVPLIIDALGHATVLTSIAYAQAANGVHRLEEIVLRDPWPGNPSRRVLTPREATNATFLTKVRVVRSPP